MKWIAVCVSIIPCSAMNMVSIRQMFICIEICVRLLQQNLERFQLWTRFQCDQFSPILNYDVFSYEHDFNMFNVHISAMNMVTLYHCSPIWTRFQYVQYSPIIEIMCQSVCTEFGKVSPLEHHLVLFTYNCSLYFCTRKCTVQQIMYFVINKKL